MRSSAVLLLTGILLGSPLAASGGEPLPARLAPITLISEISAASNAPSGQRATGGSSVAASGPWAFVTNSPRCTVFIYQLDYSSMSYEFAQEITTPGNNTSCQQGQFGTVSSTAGDVLLIGALGTQMARGDSIGDFVSPGNGAVFIYGLTDTGDWELKEPAAFINDPAIDNQQDTSQQDQVGRFGRRFAPQTQLGQLFGASLSIAAIPGQADKYLVAIGAPGYDPGPNANADANVVLGPGNTANGPPWPASGSGNPAQFDCENETNVSAPGYANCNRGLVAIYEYDAAFDATGPNQGGGQDAGPANNGLTLLGWETGTERLQQFGFSVTVSYPYVLVGAPGSTAAGNGSGPRVGGLYVIDATSALAVPNLVATAPTAAQASRGFGAIDALLGTATGGLPATDQLGQEVSLSGDRLFGASKTTARTWTISGSANPRSYTPVNQNYPSDGGDVSGRAPASFGRLTFGANIFRDPINDVLTSDAIEINVIADIASNLIPVPPNPPAPATGIEDIGEDIRLVRETLWFANREAGNTIGEAAPLNPLAGTEGRAFYYQFPCGFGQRLVDRKYSLISIPCDLPPNTRYSEVFGGVVNDPTDPVTIGDKTEIRLYRYDRVGSASNPNRSFTEVLVDGPIPDGLDRYSFLVIYADRRYFAIPGALGPADQPPLFKGLDADAYGRGAARDASIFSGSPALDDLSPSVRRFAPVPLKPSGVDVTAQPFVMISNQYPRAFELKDVLIELSGGAAGLLELWEAASTNAVEAAVYVYNPQALASNPYEAVVATAIPGFATSIQPYQGFYVKLQGLSLNLAPDATLWVPQVE